MTKDRDSRRRAPSEQVHGWEPWEARRAQLPTRASFEVRDARESARLLLMVVRAHFAQGLVPIEHADRLAAVADDDRIKVRERRIAATLLARLRMAALSAVTPGRGELPENRP